MKHALLQGEKIILENIPSYLFLEDGLKGFAKMKSGMLIITNKRVLIESNFGMGNFIGESQLDGDQADLADSIAITLGQHVVIPLASVHGVEQAKLLYKKGVRLFGDGMNENGWRIIPSNNFLKVAQTFIDLNKWQGEKPSLLKISRHFS